jgi:hypothetical protein
LTETHILHYKDQSHIQKVAPVAIPLTGCTIERENSRRPIFDVRILNHDKSISKIRFLAESENELLEWITPAKAMTGICSGQTSRKINEAAQYVFTDLKAVWLSEATYRPLETPLHLVVKSYLRASMNLTESKRAQILIFIAWLVDSGCNIDAVNSAGKTALDIAEENDLIDVAEYLKATRSSLLSFNLRHALKLIGYSYLDITFSFIAETTAKG